MKWIKVYENDAFIIDCCSETGKLRVSYFEDNHFKDEVIFKFQPYCLGCKYYDNNECQHPNKGSCIHSELWWPNER